MSRLERAETHWSTMALCSAQIPLVPQRMRLVESIGGVYLVGKLHSVARQQQLPLAAGTTGMPDSSSKKLVDVVEISEL